MSLDKLRTYFVIQGVLMLIGIIHGRALVIFYGAVLRGHAQHGNFH